MFPHAPVYPNFAAPPFPANYPQGPEQVSPPRLLESTPEVNKYFTRLQARKAVHPRNPGQSKNLGRKRQPRRPNVKRLSQPLCPSEELKLSKPLSELALDAPHIPVHDIDAYILRSPDKRISRTGLRVSRPSNAFVLYRKAYSEQIKAMIGTNKNALVSKYAGASWQMEGREIKDKFSKLARAEKRQHLACFPDYKYNPGKTRRPRHSEEATETESDNELALDEIFSDIV
ncbi:hypothetical protein F5B21DRAFT_460273 [Xylaria acuta]|nr:hypothetical protein F5B21DRAFT_460273 [Xylaria acuta]